MDDPNQSAGDSESDDTNGANPKSSVGGEGMMGEAHEPDNTTQSQDNDQ